jgi:hypothetical protein
VDGSGRDLIEVLSRYLPGAIEDNHEKQEFLKRTNRLLSLTRHGLH